MTSLGWALIVGNVSLPDFIFVPPPPPASVSHFIFSITMYFARILWLISAVIASVIHISSVDEIIRKHKTVLYFYATDCKFCAAFDPDFEYITKLYVPDNDVQIVKVNGRKHRDLTQIFGVQSFPTLKFYDHKSKNVATFQNPRTVDNVISFINKYANVEPDLSRLTLDVEVVDSAAEVEDLRKAGPVLLAFVLRISSDWKTYYYPHHFYQKIARQFDTITFALVFADEGSSELSQKYLVSNMPSLVLVGDTLRTFNTLSTNQMVNYELSREKVVEFLENPDVGETFDSEEGLANHAKQLRFEGHLQMKSGMNFVSSQVRNVDLDLEDEFTNLLDQIGM